MPSASLQARAELVQRLGIPPIPEELLSQALTHASYLNESDSRTASNERLEFLGDAVLGLIVARELYTRYPNVGEGELTRMRADVVRGSSLSRAAGRMGLGEHLLLGRGEETAGGRSRDRNLAGTFEAVLGAVYLSLGYGSARAFVRRLLRPELELLQRDGVRLDAKSTLQHLIQAKWHQPPEYVTVESESERGPQRFTVEVRAGGATLGRGTGFKKSEAQQQAARMALAELAAAGRAGE